MTLNGTGSNPPVAESVGAQIERMEKETKERIQWYVDYANAKDHDVCYWMGEANRLEAENKKLRDLLMDDAKVMAVEILGLHDSECTDTDETKDCLEEFRDCDLCEFLEPCSCPACTVARKYINQP